MLRDLHFCDIRFSLGVKGAAVDSCRKDLTSKVIQCAGRSVEISDSFFSEVGDFSRFDFLGLPDGQAVKEDRSLLRPYPKALTSPEESYPTIEVELLLRCAAESRQQPFRSRPYGVKDISKDFRTDPCRNPGAAEFVLQRSAGVIATGAGVAFAEVVADICVAFPLCRVLVVSPHAHECIRLHHAVRPYAPFVSSLVAFPHHFPRFEEDLLETDELKSFQLVFTKSSYSANLGNIVGSDIASFDVVLFTPATRAKDLMSSSLVCAAESRFRLFGLLAANNATTHDEDCHMFQVFGPWRLDVAMSGRLRAATYRHMIQNAGLIRNLPRREKDVVKTMRCLQSCTSRNSMIADLALNLTAGRETSTGGEALEEWLTVTGAGRSRTVAIICRSFLQAAKLAARLPGWRIFCPDQYLGEATRGLSACDRQKVLDAFQWNIDATQVICPQDFLVSFLAAADPEILIVASGGWHAPEFPEYWFSERWRENRVRLVIDFDDRKNDMTKRQSKGRHDEYVAQEFLPLIAVRHTSAPQQLAAANRFFNGSFRPANANGGVDHER